MGQTQDFEKTTSLTLPFQNIFEELIGNSFPTINNTSTLSDNKSSDLQYTGQNQVFQPQVLSSMLHKSDPLQLNKTSQRNHTGQYNELIKNAAKQYNVPSDLISSVIKHESNFNKDAVSQAGAQGLMQLMPGTARFLGVQDSFNPTQNIQGGARYLRQMLDQFDNNIEHALAAYNAGPGNVRKFQGIPPFKETQAYVKKVLNTFYS